MDRIFTRVNVSMDKGVKHFSCFLALMLIVLGAKAQFNNATQYPFTASQKTYTYLVGGTGIPGIQVDDAVTTGIPIGFSFPFCGTSYTTVSPGSNGYVCFGNKNFNTLSNTQTSGVAPAVMPIFDDVSGSGGTASYLTTGTAPNRVFTIEFKNWRWNYSGPVVLSYQVKLYEGGVIEFLYKREGNAPNNPSATIGILNNSNDFQTLNNTSATPTSQTTVFTTNLNTPPADGQSYLWGLIPCADTPNYPIDGPFQVCPGKPFNLSISGTSIISGLTYQWESSTNGTTWSNFTGTGATGHTMSDAITTPMYYRCNVTCANSGISYTTPTWSVGISPYYYCYCDNSVRKETGPDIGNVTMTSVQSGKDVLNYGNGAPLYNNKDANRAYTENYYNTPPVIIYRDSSYTIDITQINSSNSFTPTVASAYIDYDRDGQYNPLTERIFIKAIDGTNNPAEIVSGMITVPNTANIGYAGLRIIISEDTIKSTPCDSLDGEGEIEDYLVDIRYRPCDGPTNPGIAVSTDTSICPGYDYVITDTTYEKLRSGYFRNWQVSADNINWLNISGTSGKDTLQRTFTSQPLYYRMQVVCPVTGDSTYSQAAFVNAKAGYKCYCFSRAEGGDKDTSDIGGIIISSYNHNDGGSHLLNAKAVHKRTDLTDIKPIEFFTDSIYSINVFHTQPTDAHGDAKITIFMDFNNNHEYDPATELVYTGYTSAASFTLIDKIYVPFTAITDVPTGMRFILNNNVGPNVPSDQACGPYVSGETEDFMVIFRRKWPVGVEGIDGLENFGLYPNPTKGKFHLQFSSNADVDEVSLKVMSVTGQNIMTKSYSNVGNRFDQEFDMSGYASGVYYVELQADGKKMLRKLMVD